MATSAISQLGPISTPEVVATGIFPTPPAASIVMSFDPAGTGGVGSGNLRVNANTGKGMPAWNLQLNPGDGNPLHTFIRAEVSATTGRNHIHLPEDLDVDGTLFLAAGGAQISGDASGSLVLESAVPGAILLNWFTGARVLFGDGATGTQVGEVDNAGNASFNGNLTIAGSATVGGSPVVTVATLPPGSMVYPAVGIGVSTGSAWGASINPATLQGKLTLTTTGSSGAATLVGNTLNVPQYAGAVQVYPGAGVPVSTGTAWGASIDPATLVRTNVANIFTANQTVNGDVTASGKLSGGGMRAYVSSTADALLPDALAIRSLPGGTGTTVNAPHASGLYLNWDTGGSIILGNGSGGQVGVVDAAGNASFSSLKCISFQGANVQVALIDFQGNATFAGTLNAGATTVASIAITGAGTVGGVAIQKALTLTTTGSSGPATLVGTTLNIPQYAGGGMVYPGAGLAVSTGAAWGTSITLAAGMAAFLATPSSANLIATLTDETGTGANVFATNPVLVTPNLGTPSALVLTNATGLVTAGINASQVTLAKIQNAVASSKLLGSGAAGIGAAYSEITLGTGLSMSGTTLNASGAGMVYPAAGVPVSTGAAWGTSIVQANIAMVNVSNTFTVDQNFGGKASFAGGDFIIGLSSTPIAKANIRADGASPEDIAMSPAPGGSLYLNWDNGNGVVFGNGSGGGAASITSAGNASFNGNLSVAGTSTFTGSLTLNTGGAFLSGDSSGSLVLQSKPPGGLLLNWFTGNQILLGDGAGNQVGSIDNTGSAHFNGALLGGGLNIKQVATALPAAAGGAAIRIGPTGTFILNTYSTGGLYFNWDSGTGGVTFGNGSGVSVGSIDSAGNAHFNGTFTAGTKSFRIPHPLDKSKDLMHSCLEGPEIGVYYRGEATTRKGVAQVELPDYFEALTHKEGRTVLLTQVDEGGAAEFSMFTASRVVGGKFAIRSSAPSVKVSWEVKAIRADQPALAVTVEKRREMRPGITEEEAEPQGKPGSAKGQTVRKSR